MPPKIDGIVVDDLDKGFALEGAPPSPSRWSLVHPYRYLPTTLDNGLPIVAREPGAWTRRVIASSWGTYRRTVAAASPGDGEYQVSFSAEIEAGRWGLYYYLPERHIPAAWAGDEERTLFPALGTMEMALLVFRDRAGVPTAAEPDSVWTLAFDGSVDEAGWHKVGEFGLPDGMVRLTVSNRTDGRIVIADAIKWRRLQ